MFVECCYRFSPKGQIYTGTFNTSTMSIVDIDLFNSINVEELISFRFSETNYDGDSSYADLVNKFMFRDFGLVCINFNEHVMIILDNSLYATDSLVSLSLKKYDSDIVVFPYDVVNFGVAKTKLLTCKRPQPIALLTAIKINSSYFYMYNSKLYELTFPTEQIDDVVDADLSNYIYMLSREDAVGVSKSGQVIVRDDNSRTIRLE